MAFTKGKVSPNFKDLTGQLFGQLTAVERIGTSEDGQALWSCVCVCGQKPTVKSGSLRSGVTKSCGHLRGTNTKHGLCRRSGSTPEYALWKHAKQRAQKRDIPFNLEVSDIIIPEKCPVMGVRLNINVGHPQADSPSLDKIVPELGYTKGNVWVISYRANAFKSNFTIEELQRFVTNIAAGPTGLAGLSVRQWRCTTCGTFHDRDQNAAVNTLIAAAGCAVEEACYV